MLHYKNGKLHLFKQKNSVDHHLSEIVGSKKKSVLSFLEPLHVRLISLLGALLVAVNYIWLFLDKKPFAWDESIHYMGAVGYQRAMAEQGIKGLTTFWTQSDFYPPLTEWLTGLFFLIFSPNPDGAAFLNVVYLLGIFIAMLMIGKKIFTLDSAILSAYVFLSAATISIQSKYFMLDIPLTFYVTWAALAYVKSELFTKRRWSILYGVVFGLAMLTKWSALFFLALPPILIPIIMTIKGHEQIKKIWFNSLIVYGLTALVAFPWYGLHLLKLIKNTSVEFFEKGILENDPTYLTPQAWWYYGLGLLKQLSIPVGCLTLVGLGWAIVKKKQLLLISIWLGLPYLIFSFIGNKDLRYTMPMLPLICLCAVSPINQLSDKLRKKILLVAAMVLVAQLLFSHFGQYAGRLYQVFNSKIGIMPIIESLAPDHREWPIAAILSDVKESAKQLGRSPLCRVIPDAAQFSKVTFVVEQSKHPYGVTLASITNWPSFTDFAVTKTGELGLPFLIDKQKTITEALFNTQTANSRFEKIQTYQLPDGSEARLYKRIEQSSPELVDTEIVSLLEKQLEQLIGNYIKSSQELEIAIETYSPQETNLGRFKSIKVSSTNGLVGDFKHNPLGVPYERLAITLNDLIIDLEDVRQGRLLPYALRQLTLNAITLKGHDLNQVFSEQKDELNKCRIMFNEKYVNVRYLSKIPLEVTLMLDVKDDQNEKKSENLVFKVKRLKISKLSIPGWFVQPLLNDFNPIFKLAGFPVQVELGQLVMTDGKLTLGTNK